MISDEELDELPENRELAFVEFERIVKDRLLAGLRELNEDSSSEPLYLEYMNKVIAAAKAFEIGVVQDIEVPAVGYNAWEAYRQVSCDVEHVTTQIRIRYASRNRRGSVGLNVDTKEKIRALVGKIKTVIDHADIADEKKEALLAKLNAFLSEVDKTRTALQSVADTYIAICVAIGEGVKQLEPARKWVDSVATLLGHAKKEEDAADKKLPPPPEQKRLEPPRVAKKTKFAKSDDEIPF